MVYYPKTLTDYSNKANAQEAHARRQAMERLGHPVDVKALTRQIRAGKSTFLSKHSNRVSLHEVQGIKVVYDRLRGTIITVLPME